MPGANVLATFPLSLVWWNFFDKVFIWMEWRCFETQMTYIDWSSWHMFIIRRPTAFIHKWHICWFCIITYDGCMRNNVWDVRYENEFLATPQNKTKTQHTTVRFHNIASVNFRWPQEWFCYILVSLNHMHTQSYIADECVFSFSSLCCFCVPKFVS